MFGISVGFSPNLTYGSVNVSGLGTFGSLSVGGVAGVTGDFTVNTNKFSVVAASGNTAVAGTLTTTGNARFNGTIGFNNTAPIAKPTVAGTVITATAGTALRSLLTALTAYGLITDTSTDV